MNVLSLFDGISCGMLALERAGISVDRYVAYEIDENAIKVSKTNYPQIEHCGDVTVADFTQYQGFDLLIGGSPCFPADTLITTNTGLKEIQNIQVGDMVLTHTGKYQKVLKIGSKVSSTIILKSDKLKLECTPNHPIYSFNEKNNEYEWISAENMLGKLWALVKTKYYKDISTLIKPMVETNLHFWYKVDTISIGNENQTVYNMTVANDNSYVADGIVVHNCQDLSSMGSKKGLEGEKSKLFFEYVRAMKEMNPKYFLLENNASMSKSNRDIMSSYMGVEPIMIDSANFSAQKRRRLYWTNIPIGEYTDKNIYLKDIVNLSDMNRNDVTDKIQKYVFSGQYDGRKINTTVKNSIRGFDQKSRTIGTQAYEIATNTGLTFKIGDRYYQPTQEEFEALQTLPSGYTSCLPIKKAVFAIGNGWTVDVIAHIFKGLTGQVDVDINKADKCENEQLMFPGWND